MATLYVKKTGNDSNPGTDSLPLLTINAALTLIGGASGVGANDLVEVSAGTYVESLINNLPSGSSWSAPFTLRAKAGDTVTIKGAGQHNIAVYDTRSMFSIVQGFIFDGSTLANDQFRLGGGGTSPSAIKLINNDIINTAFGNAIYVGEFSSDIQIIGNRIHDGNFFTDSNSQGRNHGIYLTGNNCLIEGNEFYNLPAFGVHQYSQHTPPPGNNTIRGNLVYNFAGQGIAAGIYMDSGSGSVAYNNIVFQTGANGNAVGITAKNGSFAYNNTVYNCGYIGIEGVNSTIKNNISYNNGIDLDISGGIQSNNLTSNPFFVNA